jgi:hypothetical protein
MPEKNPRQTTLRGMDVKLTIQRGSLPAYEVTIPAATVAVADDYSESIGLANVEHLMLAMLLDNVLKAIILPRAEYTPEAAAHIAEMEAELATKKRELEMAKLMPLLPTLTVGNEPTSLPRGRAAAKAKKEAEKAAAEAAAQQAAQEPVTEPTPEPTPEPEPDANA